MTYAPQAELWRINHGWRRSTSRNGFTLDAQTGRWSRNDNDDIDPDSTDPGAQGPLRGIMPTVTDSRNVMLIRPGLASADPSFLVSLAYALQRGIQVTYQVEEREIEVELIGEGEHQRILLWEAAEGGTGVWERLTQEPNGFARVAREALRICHFDPETGEADPAWTERCAAACYDCLLSYSNQLQQRLIDRYTVRDFLLALTGSETVAATAGRDYDEHYQWLCERIDPASRLEREFVDYLYQHRLRLPDHAQYRPTSKVHTQPDFYYERDGLPGICVYVDGPAHGADINASRDRESRESLEDLGYRVLTIRYDQPMSEQTRSHPEVFGSEDK
ncbi:MAG TPA: DUF1998 domain-containing protein [Thermomicrobiaceae bacterium]|nr:DUF1998 domain-containing protein [Thermomicrobiaceae bacterium]